jgi:acetyltransferase-like isoleucine patch superfamily enzyme
MIEATNPAPTPSALPPPPSLRSNPSTFLHRALKRWRARWIFLRSGSRISQSGIRNVVTLNDAWLHGTRIELRGNDNTLEILSGTRCWGVTIKLIGDGLHCRIGPDCRIHGGHYTLEDRGCRLEIGAHNVLWELMCIVQEGGRVQIGNDCQIAYRTDLRNSDAHSILDGITRERINPAKDISIGDHVWIGSQVQILKGVSIGPRSVVAARSVVTKDVPAGTLVAGVPARTVRENIDWDARRI